MSSTSGIVIGPILPPGFLESKSDDVNAADQETNKVNSVSVIDTKPEADVDDDCYGPALPPDMLESRLDDDDDDVIVGPLPGSSDDAEYEKRLLRLKYADNLKAGKQQKREAWMTELPSNLKKIGLGARTFSRSTTASTDDSKKDRSEWTDTPEDRQRKILLGELDDVDSHDAEEETVSKAKRAKRDDELQKVAEELSKNRNQSLLDIHTKAKTEVKVGKDETKERKPFNRDEDLKVNSMSTEDRVKFIRQSQGLNERFKHGGSKFV